MVGRKPNVAIKRIFAFITPYMIQKGCQNAKCLIISSGSESKCPLSDSRVSGNGQCGARGNQGNDSHDSVFFHLKSSSAVTTDLTISEWMFRSIGLRVTKFSKKGDTLTQPRCTKAVQRFQG